MDRRSLLVGAAGVGALLSGCTSTGSPSRERRSLAAIDASKLLRAGYIPFPPAVMRDPNTRAMAGHFVSAINEIARQTSWRVEFIESDWANFGAGLDAQRFDVSIAPTFVTIPRAKSVDFTIPLFFAGNSAVVRANDGRFTDIASFNRPGIRLAVTQGEAGQEYAAAHLQRATVRALPGPDQSLTFQEVVSGRADAALGDAYAVSQFAARHSATVVDHFARDPYNLTPVSWAVAHGNFELLSFLNSSIQALESQGKLLEYERAAGAQWLHLRREYQLAETPPR